MVPEQHLFAGPDDQSCRSRPGLHRRDAQLRGGWPSGERDAPRQEACGTGSGCEGGLEQVAGRGSGSRDSHRCQLGQVLRGAGDETSESLLETFPAEGGGTVAHEMHRGSEHVRFIDCRDHLGDKCLCLEICRPLPGVYHICSNLGDDKGEQRERDEDDNRSSP